MREESLGEAMVLQGVVLRLEMEHFHENSYFIILIKRKIISKEKIKSTIYRVLLILKILNVPELETNVCMMSSTCNMFR